MVSSKVNAPLSEYKVLPDERISSNGWTLVQARRTLVAANFDDTPPEQRMTTLNSSIAPLTLMMRKLLHAFSRKIMLPFSKTISVFLHPIGVGLIFLKSAIDLTMTTRSLKSMMNPLRSLLPINNG